MRILLIEDDTAVADAIGLMLRAEDICVDVSDSGEDGIEFARHFDYDVIMLDLGLPDISGFEVLRLLRKANIETPLLVLSGAGTIESKVKALNAGADDYMTKPFNRDELIARLRMLVRRSRGFSASVINIGPLTLNLAARIVEIDGRRVRLSDKEYQILELLCLRRGVTVNKETLINHLYVDGEGPESYTIGLFMYRLRKKLAEASAGRDYIETVRQQGYLLRAAA